MACRAKNFFSKILILAFEVIVQPLIQMLFIALLLHFYPTVYVVRTILPIFGYFIILFLLHASRKEISCIHQCAYNVA